MTRCPVPYALVAPLGWGMVDRAVALARTRWRAARLRLAAVRVRLAD